MSYFKNIEVINVNLKGIKFLLSFNPTKNEVATNREKTNDFWLPAISDRQHLHLQLLFLRRRSPLLHLQASITFFGHYFSGDISFSFTRAQSVLSRVYHVILRRFRCFRRVSDVSDYLFQVHHFSVAIFFSFLSSPVKMALLVAAIYSRPPAVVEDNGSEMALDK